MKISRRELLIRSALLSLSLGNLPACRSAPGIGQRSEKSRPYFDLSNQELITIPAQHLRFGSSIYPFRKPHDPLWIINECLDIGFTGVRFSYPREMCQRGPEEGDSFNLPESVVEVAHFVRDSKLDVVMTIHGHPGDSQAHPMDWPRNPDGTIDGKAAARSYTNYARWLVNHTKDYVHTYELWNEAFGVIEDQKFRKSFGPGGTKENADNYANMALPALQAIRQLAPGAKIAIEGNYWNVERSAAQSPAYQRLLVMADFAVRHPYDYKPAMYSKVQEGKAGFFFQTDSFFRTINPELQWFFTEYNATAKSLGIPMDEMKGVLQAKAVLRTTVLHMRHGINHLFPFAIHYPSSPSFTFLDDHQRRPVWFAMQRFMKACRPKSHSITASLERTSQLKEEFRDLSVATSEGFTYCIWQETSADDFKIDKPPKSAAVVLKSSHSKPMRLLAVLDPITGKEVVGVKVDASDGGAIVISLPVKDYPVICFLQT